MTMSEERDLSREKVKESAAASVVVLSEKIDEVTRLGKPDEAVKYAEALDDAASAYARIIEAHGETEDDE